MAARIFHLPSVVLAPVPATPGETSAFWEARAVEHQEEMDRLLALAAREAERLANCRSLAARARER